MGSRLAARMAGIISLMRTEGARKLIPKPKPQVQLWKQELRKALARVLRKKGTRVR
jgi:hypothetical protein